LRLLSPVHSSIIHGVEKFSENFPHILVLSLRSLKSTLKISCSFPKPFLKSLVKRKWPIKEERIPGRHCHFKKQVDGCWGRWGFQRSSTPSQCSHRRCQRRALFSSYCVGGRDQQTRNLAPHRRLTPLYACQPPKAIGRVTGGGSS